MPAIKATKSKDLKVINCVFSGFETDIELENVEDFISKNNRFSRQNNPQLILEKLIGSIKESNIPPKSKEALFQETVGLLSSGTSMDNSKKAELKQKILKYIGDKAADYFVQLAVAVSAGLILMTKR